MGDVGKPSALYFHVWIQDSKAEIKDDFYYLLDFQVFWSWMAFFEAMIPCKELGLGSEAKMVAFNRVLDTW